MSQPAPTPVCYYDRYQKRVVEEAIYGEKWLRWAYANPLGRLATWAIIRRAWFSVIVGARMNSSASAKRIPDFIRQYSIDMSQFEIPESGWGSFNDFFIRRVKASARPIDADSNSIILPADGRHIAYPDGADLKKLVVKGRPFTLEELLGNKELAQHFEGGTLVVSRLCPTDYHRFHFPLAGTPSPSKTLDGPLDSVSPVAICEGARSLCANKRELTLLDTPAAGRVAIVEVGAACVGRIVQTYRADKPVKKGDEKGYFLFGGSTVISVFERGRVELAADIVEQSANGIETYARMGDVLGHVK